MRLRVALLLSLCLLLLLALQPQLTDAKKKKAKKQGATPAPATSSADDAPAPTHSARDDDPMIKAVRKLRNTAMRHMDKKEYEQSIEKIREAIAKMHDRVFGETRATIVDPKEQSMDAAYYAQLLSDYGTVLIRDQQYDEAADVLEDASAMAKKIFGDSHPSYGLAMRSLADAYMAKKEYSKAIDRYKTLRRHVKLGLGVTHEAYMEANLRIGEAYKRLGDLKRAVKVYKKVIKDQDGQVNMETKGVAEIFMELATTQNLLGVDSDEALRNAEAAREMFKTRDGDDTIDYAFSLNALAGVKMREQKIDEAYQLLHQAHSIALRLYGKGHKMVLASAKTLQDVKKRMDELHAEAKSRVEKEEL
ncbi:Secreted rxlr effector peptide protein [Globisporangium polare]